jgi:hypothetical protein
MYKVGEDIEPGEYTLEAEDVGYVEVSSNSRHQIDGIITNDNFETNKIITVEEGQYLSLINSFNPFYFIKITIKRYYSINIKFFH